MTKKKLSNRFAAHKFAAKKGLKSPLYCAMRKYGDFIIVLVEEFETKESCYLAEIRYIKEARESGIAIYNLADGGQCGYVLPEERKEEWKTKLSKARQGAKPALGMKHTEENKKFFSECSKRRKLRYPDLDVTKISFTKANRLCGISKTHYYRLLKRAKSNDLS